MTLLERTGDIFTSTADAIGHGVNVHGNMGGGIAAQFAERFPDMLGGYQAVCNAGALKPGDFMPWWNFTSPGWLVIYNIASQEMPGCDARLDWLAEGVAGVIAHAEQFKIRSLALPQIGCGIGGLEWDDVLPVLAALAAGTTVDIEAWTYAPVLAAR